MSDPFSQPPGGIEVQMRDVDAARERSGIYDLYRERRITLAEVGGRSYVSLALEIHRKNWRGRCRDCKRSFPCDSYTFAQELLSTGSAVL
jgi:hypothetical protein